MRRAATTAAPAATAAALALALAGAALLGGCGEKIEAPEPRGLFGVNAYYADTLMAAPDVTQLAEINNILYVVTESGQLSKRDLDNRPIRTIEGLEGPAALCRDDMGLAVLVWEQGARRLSTFSTANLSQIGAAELPDVQRGVAIATCPTGVEMTNGARTFLYVSDPDSGVVHRYAVFSFDDIRPWGILCRSDGDGARFVHVPAGLAPYGAGRMLVCDADTLRNWVISFDPTPDESDTARVATRPDPWRGKAVVIDVPSCSPEPATTDYVLGDAAVCGQVDWVGGPSDANGAFHGPLGVALDGSGRVYVADAGNDRVQIFTAQGDFVMPFGSPEDLPRPVSLGVVDARVGYGDDDVNYGAYVFALSRERGVIQRFISYEHYIDINQDLPPEN